MRIAKVAGILLTGCGRVDAEEARAVAEANDRVMSEVDELLEQIEAPALYAHAADGTYWFDGTITGTMRFTGDITATGTSTSIEGGSLVTYDLQLDYRDVTVGDLVMSGMLDQSATISIENGEVVVTRIFDGELELRGSARGRGGVDYVSTATEAGTSYEGTVGDGELE